MVPVPAGAACIFQCDRDCTGGMSAVGCNQFAGGWEDRACSANKVNREY